MLWIGAAHLLILLRSGDIRCSGGSWCDVLVKNPINPDIELWIGAIERIARAGITRIGAIHRASQPLRRHCTGTSQLQLPIELRRRIPDLPLICDPVIFQLNTISSWNLAEAMDLNFDGLISSRITTLQLLWAMQPSNLHNDLKEL